MATLMNLGAVKEVVIFSRSSCCMCYSIKALIYSFGTNPEVYELDEHPHGDQLEKKLKDSGRNVPIVFIGKKEVGGAKEVMNLHVSGELVNKLTEAGAIHFSDSSDSE